MSATITYSQTRSINERDIVELYQANDWSAAEKPVELHRALLNSHALVSAWDDSLLVGIGNAISDGSLVVYYPHLLVLPGYRGRGVGRGIMQRLAANYAGFHQQVLVADREAVEFYTKCGFERAGTTEPMWVYAGKEH